MKNRTLVAALLLGACGANAPETPLHTNELFNIAARSASADVDFHLTGRSLDRAYAAMCAHARCDRRENYTPELNIMDGAVGYVFYHKQPGIPASPPPYVLAFVCAYDAPLPHYVGRPPPPPTPPRPEPTPRCTG